MKFISATTLVLALTAGGFGQQAGQLQVSVGRDDVTYFVENGDVTSAVTQEAAKKSGVIMADEFIVFYPKRDGYQGVGVAPILGKEWIKFRLNGQVYYTRRLTIKTREQDGPFSLPLP